MTRHNDRPATVRSAFPNASIIDSTWIMPGEVLFVPAYTLHTVSAGLSELAVSGNVFSLSQETVISHKMLSAGLPEVLGRCVGM